MHTDTHTSPSFFWVQEETSETLSTQGKPECSTPVKNQTGAKKHCFESNGALVESQMKQEQEEGGLLKTNTNSIAHCIHWVITQD